MYYHVSAVKKHTNELRFSKDVTGEEEREKAIEEIENMATDLQETLLITIVHRTELITVKPKPKEA